MLSVPDFEIALLRSVEDGAPQAPARVSCHYVDDLPLLRMVHLPSKHFSETFLDKVFVQWTRNLTCLWGTYRWFHDHGLVQSCQANPATLNRVTGKHSAALSMSFFKGLIVEVRERGYAMVDGFSDLNNADSFNKVELPFNPREDLCKVDGLTKLQFFNAVMQKFSSKGSLNSTKDISWKTISNHAVDEVVREDRERRDVSYSTTQQFITVTLMKSWMGRFRYFYDFYLGQLCL